MQTMFTVPCKQFTQCASHTQHFVQTMQANHTKGRVSCKLLFHANRSSFCANCSEFFANCSAFCANCLVFHARFVSFCASGVVMHFRVCPRQCYDPEPKSIYQGRGHWLQKINFVIRNTRNNGLQFYPPPPPPLISSDDIQFPE